MFPITPIELREGVIIGKKPYSPITVEFLVGTIHRNTRFTSSMTPRETTKFAAPIVVKATTRKGKTFTELRLPEDWSAAIIRR